MLNCLSRCLKIIDSSITFGLASRRFKSISVISAEFCKGQGKSGVELGPQAILSTGFIERLRQRGDQVDCSIVSEDDLMSVQASSSSSIMSKCKVKNLASVIAFNNKLSHHVKEQVSSHDQTIVLGGDHSIAIGSISGHSSSHEQLCVIWIDAHADINTLSSSNSGNMHGMPVSFLLREMNSKPSELHSRLNLPRACISSSNISYIGLRDVDQRESEMLVTMRPPIMQFTCTLVKQLGPREVINRILSHINPNLDRMIHVSFDIDALDPSIAPSTGTPVAGGLTMEEAIIIGQVVQQTNKLSVLDVVEVNPQIGDEKDVQVTLNGAQQVIRAFIG